MRIEILRRIFRENENKKNELPQDRLSWQQQRSPQPGQSLNYTTITFAGLGWAGKGWDLLETQRPSDVRCWQWLTLGTGQWGRNMTKTR